MPVVSVLSPNVVDTEYPDDMFNVMSDIVTRKIVSYPNSSSNAQSLVIGASSDLRLESRGDTSVHLNPSAAVNFFHTTVDAQEARTENKFMVFSASNNNTEMLAPSSQITLVPGDGDKTTNVGSMVVNENMLSQILNTGKSEFKMMKSLSVLGDFALTGQLFVPTMNSVNMLIDNNLNVLNHVSNGSMFGNNLNLWIDKDDAAGDRATNQIGYGFRINSNSEELELFKYKRFSYLDSNSQLQKSGKTQYRKVAQFGFGITSYDKESDMFDNPEVFQHLEPLTSMRQRMYDSNLNMIRDAEGVGGNGFWIMSSNANIYYTGGCVGINTSEPNYTLDVNGSVMVSETLVTNSFGTASDRRIKSDITRLENSVCLEKMRMMSPCSFTLDTDNTTRSGFIAQDVGEIIPESVHIMNNPNLNISDFQFLDYSAIITYITGALQEIDRRVSALEQ